MNSQSMSDLVLIHGCRPLTRALNSFSFFLGLTPQALCCRPLPRALLNLSRPPERSPWLRARVFTVFEDQNAIHKNIFDANR